jgi:hypothetical protein
VQTTNALVIDRVTLLAEFGRYPANSVKRLVHVDVHDFVLDVLILALLFRAVLRLVVIARTRHMEQLQLSPDAQILAQRIYLGFSMFKPNAKDTLRKKSFSTSRRPIFFIKSSSVYIFFCSAFRSEGPMKSSEAPSWRRFFQF